MTKIESHPRLVRFGAFEADLRTGELRKDGVKLKFSGQPFQVLAILLERPGEVVTREELQKRLWPDTFVDVERNLNTAINKIREVLGDSAESPKFVETLPRRGYRFIAPMDGDGSAVERPIEDPAALKAVGPRSQRRYLLVLLGAIIIIVGGILLWKTAIPTPGTPKVLRFKKLTNDGQAKFGPMVTDGSRIYFTELLPGPRNIAVQVSVKGGEVTSLPIPLSSPGVLDLSRDGTELLVANGVTAFRVGIDPAELWVQPVAGGSPRRVGTILAADARFGSSETSIIYGNGQDINSVNEDGSSSRKLLTVDRNPVGDEIVQPGIGRWLPNTPFAFRSSPDGRVFRFSHYDSAVDSTITEVRADGSRLRTMFGGCCGEWTMDGRYFIFQNSHEGGLDLWASPGARSFWKRDDKPTQLTAGPLDFQFPLSSKDGKEIFAIGNSRRAELVRYDAQSSQFVPFLSGLSAQGLSFSRDGQWVAYVSYPEGTLWRSKVDGSERAQLTFPPLRVDSPRWSPDGRQIAFSATLPETTFNIYLISSEGGAPQRLLPSEQIQTDVSWSPDGKSLLFGSLPYHFVQTQTRSDNLKTSAPIYIIDFVTKRVSPLTGSSGFFSPHWSPDGRYIAANTMAQRRLMLFDLSTQKWTAAAGSRIAWANWSHDGKYIYFLDYQNAAQGFHERVARFRLNDRKIENIVDVQNIGRLTTGPGGVAGGWFGLTPDDSPLFARDISSQEIYALEMEWP